jgi:TetR/AcrR family transcriptional repressor of mexJK operon
VTPISRSAVKPKKKVVKGRRYSAGRPTQDDLELRKARILDVATELFVTHGYAETALVDVAKQAGVATRTIYQHYGDKADVFKAMIDNRVAVTEHELPIIDPEDSLFDIILATAHYVGVMAYDGTAIPFQRLMIAESHRFPDLMRQIFESLFHRLHSNVINVFETLAKLEKIPAGNHEQTTKFFIDLLLGTAPMQLTMNWITTGPSEAELRDKVTLFIGGRFGAELLTESAKSLASTAKRSKN